MTKETEAVITVAAVMTPEGAEVDGPIFPVADGPPAEVAEAASEAVVLAASEAAASEAAVPEEVGSQKLLRDLPRCRKSLKSLYLYKKHAMRYPHLIIPILFLFLWQCTPQLQERYAQAEDLSYRLESTPAKSANTLKRNPCFTNESYIPDTNHLNHSPIKYVRVNFHWVNSSDSSKNYNGKEAIEFTKGLLHTASKDLETNNKLWFPYKNNIPAIPTQYRYVLTADPSRPNDNGIYFHYDDELCYYIHKGKNRNLFDRRVIQKYSVGQDSVLNIFIMPHHPDSVASPTYMAGGVGVALGNAIKIAGLYENQAPYWVYRGVLNHEVGHVFGLVHAWVNNDGCSDTPPHPGECWNRTVSPPCDTMATNNVMDYNALQNAWTPCQIGKVHRSMATPNTRARKVILPTWCTLKENKTINIRDSITWNGAKDLEGHIVIEKGGLLSINCRVSMPPGGRILIRPGGELRLGAFGLIHNDCGQEWEGIVIQEQGKAKGILSITEGSRMENMRHPAPKS
jgi:hypothetical protein